HATRAAAATAGGHDPDRISYTITLRAIRRALITASTPASITAEALSALLPPRRRRSYPRLTLNRTATRRAARAGRTGTASYTTTITTPDQASDLPSP